MISRLLFICFTFVSFHGLSESKFRDLLNGTEIHYELKDTSVFSCLYGSRNIPVQCMVVLGEKEEALQRLNQNIFFATLELLTSEECGNRFLEYFRESVPFCKGHSLSDSISIKPHIDLVRSKVLSLCDNILVVYFRIEYNNNGGYSCVRYFNMKTGQEVDKGGIISKSERAKFESLVSEKIPAEFRYLVSKEEIENGDAFFIGAGFYYVLQGSFDNPLHGFCGIPSVYVRFSLEEIQPLLADNGLFSCYKAYKTGTSKQKKLQELSVSDYTMFRGEYYYLRKYPREVFYKQGVKKSSCYDDSSKMKLFEYFYNDQGKVSLQVNYIRDDHLGERDSILFAYHSNGNLEKVIEYKNSKYYIEKRCELFFDQSGNLVKKIYYSNDQEISISHYVFLDSLVLVDSYDKRNGGLHYFSSSEIYEYQYGQLLTKGRHDEDLLEFKAMKKDDDIEIWEGGKPLISFHYLDGKLQSYFYYHAKHTFQYNSSGDPVLFEYTKEYSDKIVYQLSVEYDERGLPILFSKISDWGNYRYVFVYE